MKTISQTYKDNIKQLGKEITYEITYDNATLGDEDILNANLHYDGGMLKSVMKQLDIELYNDLPIGTELTYKFGVKVDDANYEKINYGNFIVYSSEKLEDSNTYKLVCYDKMLYAMKDYETITGITYPITIRNYINALCNHLGLTFANSNANFTNYDKTIENELYIDNEGNNIGYTYRDVLDELAQATASTICINDNDELEIRYITNANEEKTSISGTSFNMTAYDGKIDLDLLGNTTQDTTTGKNLFNKDGNLTNYTASANNSTITKTDKAITFTTTSASSAGFYTISNTFKSYIDNLDTSKTYTISADITTSASTPIRFGFESNYTQATINGKTRISNTSTSSSINSAFICYAFKSGINVKVENIQIEQSSSFSSYEPYTNGASPNPNYPQNIETTTGRNTIEVVGKNLFDKDSANLNKGVNTSNGNLYNDTNCFTTDFIKVETSGTNYTASGYSTSANRVYGAQYDSNKQYVGSIATNVGIKTFYISNENTKYIRLTGLLNEIDTYQLEKGSSSSTYEPYIGNSYEVNLGKNLFDKDNANVYNGYFTPSSPTITSNANHRIVYIPIQPNTTYTIQKSNAGGDNTRFGIGTTANTPTTGVAVSQVALNNTATSLTIATNASAKYLIVWCYFTSNTAITFDNLLSTIQIEKGTQATSYSPYFTPIELCKIGTYQDRLFKASGKNLFKYFSKGWIDGSGVVQTSSANINTDFIELEPNTSYTISANTTFKGLNFALYDENKTFVTRYTYSNISEKTINSSTYKYTRCWVNYNETTINEEDLVRFQVQLEKSSTATSYEPYGNYWYKYKAIGKYTFTGVSPEGWAYKGTTNSRSVFQWSAGLPDKLNTSANLPILCNNFTQCTIAQTDGYAVDEGIANGIYNGYAIKIITKQASDLATFKTWLANHTTYVYYQLATPTYTRIDNEELIGQLEHIRLLNGYNNVISSSPITLDYVSSVDTIDEEYLKDINVNFGEEVKPINTITFKRSGDTDVISLSYPEDLEDDKKNEIVISENQILNYDNRDEYLKGILDRLYGLTYCLNDYTSTGITYYDLCDRYEVSITKTDDEGNVIETNFYPCIMFNDEINVNQGLQEIVHTDRPEESTTDYNTTTKTDRLKTRTDLIVNKQEGFIEAVTGSLQIGEDGQSEVVNGVVTRQSETERTIKVITSFDENGNPTGVKTTKGYKFDGEGLNITSSDNTYKTKIDEKGTYYYDGEEILGQTTKEGSKFKDMELYGEFKYGKDEKDETAMFVSMLYNDGTEECFGHFYNGREVE